MTSAFAGKGFMRHEAKRILIVEDKVIIAMDVEDMVSDCGCVPVGPVSNVADGIALVQQTALDGAVLDINLGEERVWPLAEVLDDQGVQIVLASGYATTEVPARFRDRPMLEKPLSQRALAAALESLGLIEPRS